MKIGVLADTHIPDLLPELPARVNETLRGVDIILHAGDICRLEVLHQLESLTITMAVFGNRDDEQARQYLEDKKVIEFGDRRIGLIHGHRAVVTELREAVGAMALGRPRYEGLYAYVLSQFSDVDAIVFGHSHQPYVKMRAGVLLFNPGAVAPGPGVTSSVGVLEIEGPTMVGRIVPL